MADLDWLKEAEEAGLRLKELIRQSHEAYQDLKLAKRELENLIRETREATASDITAAINLMVDHKLNDTIVAVELHLNRLCDSVMFNIEKQGMDLIEKVPDRILRKLREPNG